MNGAFSARVRSLTLNNTKRFGNFSLHQRGYNSFLGVLGYSQDIAANFRKYIYN